jgi:hypothetical protein
MPTRLFLFFTINLLALTNCFSRSPAVESFVEIEVNNSKDIYTSQSKSEVFFNFETDNQIKSKKASSFPFDTIHLIFLLTLSLPIVSWLLVLNHLKAKAYRENVNNVQTLSNYKIKQEEKNNSENNYKKAS